MTSASRTMLLGILLGLAANGLHLLASYLVKVNPISAADNLIFRASTQFVGFGIWTVLDTAYKRKKRSNNQDEEIPDSTSWFAAIICNFAMSITILLQFVAVKMLPLSDFVTFQFTAPVFAMLATTVVMRRRVPLIGFFFIGVIFVGDCLVAQPSFIFGSASTNSAYKNTYIAGTILTFVVAIGSGVYRVLQATSRLVPTCQFMLLGGLTSLAVGFLCPIMNLPSNLFNWTYVSTHFHTLLPTSLASLASALLLLVAVKFTGNPVLISVVRTTEILMSLFLDTVSTAVDTENLMFWIKVIGACLVTSQIICISLLDRIQEKIEKHLGGNHIIDRSKYEEIKDICNNDLEMNGGEAKGEIRSNMDKETTDEALLLDP